jgi:hypothetical protein
VQSLKNFPVFYRTSRFLPNSEQHSTHPSLDLNQKGFVSRIMVWALRRPVIRPEVPRGSSTGLNFQGLKTVFRPKLLSAPTATYSGRILGGMGKEL